MSLSWRVESRTVDAVAPGAAAFRRFVSPSDPAGVWLDSSTSRSAIYPSDGPLSVVYRPGSGAGASHSASSHPASSHPELLGSGPIADHLRSLECVHRADGFFDVLRAGLNVVAPESLGWVGAFGYELKNHVDAVRCSPTAAERPHVSPHPDAALLFADRALLFDATSTKIIALTCGDPTIDRLQRDWLDTAAAEIPLLQNENQQRPSSHTSQHRALYYTSQQRGSRSPSSSQQRASAKQSPLLFEFDHSHAEYLACIAEAQRYIAAGDTYELCLTTTAEGPALQDPFAAYLQLRRTSPVPYGAYVRFGDVHVLSASPERFLSLSPTGAISAKPIKGTRGRSNDPQIDESLRRELKENPKDRAENLMIVDLLRNDLSIVAEDVRVPSIFDVETYSHVHQLVSTIEGQLAPGRNAVDLLKAAFPGGSMTGAPKVRTMELIEGLEKRARGLYSGAIGRLSSDAELSITIRTVVADAQHTTFGVGGAIVADSDPESEWQEILVKASAMLDALGAQLAH